MRTETVREMYNHTYNNKYVRLAAILFFFGFFLGYTMRFLDFIKSPVFTNIGVIYPVHQEASPRIFDYALRGYEYPSPSVDLLYVVRNNIVSGVLLASIGALAAVPTAIYTFIIGISSGASIPEVLEFANLAIAIKTIIAFLFYSFAAIISASLGLELGASVVAFAQGKKFSIEKSVYDRAIVAGALIVINIILQYVLLVA